jgi:hypothetical protein
MGSWKPAAEEEHSGGKAAELLWRAAAGDGHFGGEEPFARWRYHFALADQAEQMELRAELRRHLSLAEHFSKQSSNIEAGIA